MRIASHSCGVSGWSLRRSLDSQLCVGVGSRVRENHAFSRRHGSGRLCYAQATSVDVSSLNSLNRFVMQIRRKQAHKIRSLRAAIEPARSTTGDATRRLVP